MRWSRICSVILTACLLSVFAACAGQDVVVEDVCEQEGFPGVNLSCEREGGLRECFSRDKLCDGTPFCADESDEGQSSGTGLDCNGSLTGRKATVNGKVEPGFLCSNGSILDLDQLCDGIANCEEGDDETYPLCANKCRLPYYGGCSHTRECLSTNETASCGLCRPGFARNSGNYEHADCLVAYFRFRTTVYSTCDNQREYVYVYLETLGVLDQSVQVDLKVIDGTAIVGEDFTLSTTRLQFPTNSRGGTSRSVYIRALNIYSRGVKTVILEASAGDWSFATGRNRTIVTIRDCLHRLLYVYRYSTNEGSRARGYVRLDSRVDELPRDLFVEVTTRSGSAIGNVDYVTSQFNLTFPQGSRGGHRQNFYIPTIDDNIIENREFFRVTATAINVEPGLYSSTSYTRSFYITDNDKFIVELEQPSYTVREGESVEVCLVNTTNVDRGKEFTVQFYTSYDIDLSSNVTATADLDYEAKFREIDYVFPNDINKLCVIIKTYHDALKEERETFNLTVVRKSGVGQFSTSPRTTEIFILDVNVDQVSVSIEKQYYSITLPRKSVEICIISNDSLDELGNFYLQSSYNNTELLLPETNGKACAVFTFPSDQFTTNGRTQLVQVVIMSDNRRVTLDRSHTEVVLFSGNNNRDECPVLFNPTNGQVHSNGRLPPGSLAIYSCDVGLIPDSPQFRECGNDLVWSGNSPSCIEDLRGIVESMSNELFFVLLTYLF